MDEGKILFVNLSKGRTGELNSKLLGMIFVMKFQSAAMSRANIPEDQRRDFSLYVDEFQNFSTDSFSSILSEARKYRLNLIVANQFISQLSDDIRDAVFGNVGSVISFRPTFDVDDLVRLPNFSAVSRVMANNVPSQPFSMAMLPPLGHQNPKLSVALKRMSYLKHGKPKAVVEQAIFKRLETLEPPKPKFNVGAGKGIPAWTTPRPGGAAAGTAANPAGKPSFLDEWLEKRKQRLAQGGTAPATTPKPSPGLAQRADALFGSSSDPTSAPAEASSNSPIEQKPMPPKPVAASAPPVSPVAKDGTLEMGHGDVHTIDKSPEAPKPAKVTPKSDVGNISGTEQDKEDAKKLSEAIKAKSNIKPAQTKATAPTEPVVAENPKDLMGENDEMYIDKDGVIHYKEEIQ